MDPSNNFTPNEPGLGQSSQPTTPVVPDNMAAPANSQPVVNPSVAAYAPTPGAIGNPVASVAVSSVSSAESFWQSPKRFLLAYIVSIFSGLSLLSGSAILGYALFDHFLAPKNDSASFYFDLAPFYVSVMSAMTIFAVLYLLASQYVARSTRDNEADQPDWRAYKVSYAIFTAILLTWSAGVAASLLYIPLSSAFVTEDMAGYQIGIQILGGLHVLLWIGLLIWQERLIKRGENVWLQGSIITILALVIVVLSGIFLVAGKTDQRVDARTSNDLSSIQSGISVYQMAHNGDLPKALSDLDLKATDTVKKRLADYKYTVKSTNVGSTTSVTNRTATTPSSFDDTSDTSLSSIYTSQYTDTGANYQLCATFRTDTTKNQSDQPNLIQELTSASSLYADRVTFTVHLKGEVCFDR